MPGLRSLAGKNQPNLAGMHFTIDIEPEEEFRVFAISFASELHRLAWLLNAELNLRLERIESIEVTHKKSLFTYESLTYNCPESGISYAIFQNDPTGVALLNEFKVFDFILKISPCCDAQAAEIAALLKRLKEVRAVMTAKSENLKNKHNLIIE